jgi:hypothetical protein
VLDRFHWGVFSEKREILKIAQESYETPTSVNNIFKKISKGRDLNILKF